MTGRALLVVEQPAPLDRLAEVVADPMTLEVVGQRVMDGWTVKEIARAWDVPPTAFNAWLHGDVERKAAVDAARRLHADQLALETVGIADDSGDAALRVKTRFQLATFQDRERFGERKAVVAKQRVIVDRRVGDTQETVAIEVGGE